MAKVYPEPNSGCWLWDGAIHRTGYGVFGLTAQKRTAAAHRVSYELHVGPIPAGMVVCHKCDVRSCVNPAHLFAGSQTENLLDMVAKGRHHDQRGSRNHAAKLTDSIVREIRDLRARGDTYQAIASRYGVSRSCVTDAATGQKWSVVA
jgi:hypothetical protein